jgi:hypothetical protein
MSERMVKKVWGVRADLVQLREDSSAFLQLIATRNVERLLSKAKGAQVAGLAFLAVSAVVAASALYAALSAIPKNNTLIEPTARAAALAGLIVVGGLALALTLGQLQDLAWGKWSRRVAWTSAAASLLGFATAGIADLFGAGDLVLYIGLAVGVLGALAWILFWTAGTPFESAG